MDEAMLFRRPRDSNRCQQVTQADSCPHGVPDGSGSPIESLLARTDSPKCRVKQNKLKSKGTETVRPFQGTDCLLREILLLTPVPGTDKGHWDRNNGAPFTRCNLLHAQVHRLWDSCDLQSMLGPGQLWHCSVVSNHIQSRGCNPASCLQVLERWLRVERMHPSVA